MVICMQCTYLIHSISHVRWGWTVFRVVNSKCPMMQLLSNNSIVWVWQQHQWSATLNAFSKWAVSLQRHLSIVSSGFNSNDFCEKQFHSQQKVNYILDHKSITTVKPNENGRFDAIFVLVFFCFFGKWFECVVINRPLVAMVIIVFVAFISPLSHGFATGFNVNIQMWFVNLIFDKIIWPIGN